MCVCYQCPTLDCCPHCLHTVVLTLMPYNAIAVRVQQEPAAAVAKRGQALVFCSANLHSGWHNERIVSRKTLLMAFAPGGVACGSPFGQVQGQGFDFFRKLRPKMRSDRAHLVPREDQWPYFFESTGEGRGGGNSGNYTREWLKGVRPIDAKGAKL